MYQYAFKQFGSTTIVIVIADSLKEAIDKAGLKNANRLAVVSKPVIPVLNNIV